MLDSRGNPARQLTRFSFRLFIFSDENSDEIIFKFFKEIILLITNFCTFEIFLKPFQV